MQVLRTTDPYGDRIPWSKAPLSMIVFLLLAARSAVAGEPFSIIDLGTLNGYPISWATSINDRGRVVGFAESLSAGITHAVLFNEEGVVDLGILPGGSTSEASSINNRGQIVGFATTVGDRSSHAVRFENGKVTDIGPAGIVSFARSINDRGQVVGDGYIGPNETDRALLFLGGGMVKDLGILPGGEVSAAHGINNRGQAVGIATTAPCCTGRPLHPVIFENGTVTDLGTLPGVPDILPYDGFANSINNRGQAVGLSTDATGVTQAVLFEHGRVSVLVPNGSAASINDSGEVVGSANIGARSYAFLYKDGTTINLGNLPGFTDSVATSINNRGDIVGAVFTGGGPGRPPLQEHAVLWRRQINPR